MSENTVTITMSEDAARATLRAVEDDPDRTKWGHHQWTRGEVTSALRAALDAIDTSALDRLLDEARAMAEAAEREAEAAEREAEARAEVQRLSEALAEQQQKTQRVEESLSTLRDLINDLQ